MKKLSFALSLFVALALALPAWGATVISRTTLSAAISSTSTNTVVVASATGITANVTALFIDAEYMTVNSVNGTTLSVTRQGRATTHASGALVWLGPPIAFKAAVPPGFPAGSCSRTTELYLPYVNVVDGTISDCLGGVWVNGVTSPLQNTQFRVWDENPGYVVYTAINTNGTTLGATTMYCSEVDLPANKLVTGIGILNGTTVGTDNHLVALYDASGNLLANSATAGALAAGASVFQNFNFTANYFAVGPATYFGCMQTNGTTATVRMLTTGQQDTLLTKGVTGQTFGTVPATFTAPTTFTTAVGPYLYLY